MRIILTIALVLLVLSGLPTLAGQPGALTDLEPAVTMKSSLDLNDARSLVLQSGFSSVLSEKINAMLPSAEEDRWRAIPWQNKSDGSKAGCTAT